MKAKEVKEKKKLTQAHKEKIAKANKGNQYRNRAVTNGEKEFKSLVSAAKELGIRPPSLIGRAIRNGYKAGGFFWKYLED